MTDNKRDMLDVTTPSTPESSIPAENMPRTSERPVVSPQKGAYFLDKFLEAKNEETDAAETKAKPAGNAPESPEELQGNIVSALQEIYDPEIPVNIYELGLIYAVNVADDYSVRIEMTLTTPHCPVAESMPGEVEMKAASVDGVNGVEVDLVWEPPWDMSKMSDEARLELGLL
ncbi:SUF system Fe-S cluster assembly protein [Kordiimonas aquimaris]|uniref:SUF system Fe-S cluster assembly protein n=1 Tax=Kordiimonas aquimaris TaxID=707591 RepID=UPI0021D0B1B9|nr:SUF system Fe-S cluster assembly protein [Kordiimonas aquimaris]